MKMLMTVSLFLVSGLALASENHGDHSKMNHSKMDHSKMDHSKHGKENKEFNMVLKGYERLHQAFFDNDNAKVQKQAAEVAKSIDGIKDEKISKTLGFAKKKLNEIASSSDFEANKTSFGTVSHALLIVLEKHSMNKGYGGYYCPMVKKYWIQNTAKSKKVMNPYASSSMPECGSPKKIGS